MLKKVLLLITVIMVLSCSLVFAGTIQQGININAFTTSYDYNVVYKTTDKSNGAVVYDAISCDSPLFSNDGVNVQYKGNASYYVCSSNQPNSANNVAPWYTYWTKRLFSSDSILQKIPYENSYYKVEIFYADHTIMNNVSNAQIYPPPPSPISNAEEYVKFTSPSRDAYKTTGKAIAYRVDWRIKVDTGSNVEITYLTDKKVSFADDANVRNVTTVLNTSQQDGNYYVGTGEILVIYKDSYTGPVGCYAKVLSKSANKYIEASRLSTILSFTDSNADGKDDTTGESTYVPPANPDGNNMILTTGLPKRSDYGTDIIGSVAYGFDTLVYYIMLPFKMFSQFFSLLATNVGGLVLSFGDFSKFVGQIFSWMPAPLLNLVLVITGVIGSIAVLRWWRK